jgi:hypothetical protein
LANTSKLAPESLCEWDQQGPEKSAMTTDGVLNLLLQKTVEFFLTVFYPQPISGIDDPY